MLFPIFFLNEPLPGAPKHVVQGFAQIEELTAEDQYEVTFNAQNRIYTDTK